MDTGSGVGAAHVGLGSDFDGAVPTPFHVSGMGIMTAALRDAGLGEPMILSVMGGSAIRLFGTALPAS